MNPFYKIWFWLLIISIIGFIVFLILYEIHIVTSTTFNWLWILFIVSAIFSIIAFILYLVDAYSCPKPCPEVCPKPCPTPCPKPCNEVINYPKTYYEARPYPEPYVEIKPCLGTYVDVPPCPVIKPCSVVKPCLEKPIEIKPCSKPCPKLCPEKIVEVKPCPKPCPEKQYVVSPVNTDVRISNINSPPYIYDTMNSNTTFLQPLNSLAPY